MKFDQCDAMSCLFSVFNMINPVMNHKLNPQGSKHVKLFVRVNQFPPWKQLSSNYHGIWPHKLFTHQEHTI